MRGPLSACFDLQVQDTFGPLTGPLYTLLIPDDFAPPEADLPAAALQPPALIQPDADTSLPDPPVPTTVDASLTQEISLDNSSVSVTASHETSQVQVNSSIDETSTPATALSGPQEETSAMHLDVPLAETADTQKLTPSTISTTLIPSLSQPTPRLSTSILLHAVVFYPSHLGRYVPTARLKQEKWTDASNAYDEEVEAHEMDWSDDEQEMAAKRQRKMVNKKDARGGGSVRGGSPTPSMESSSGSTMRGGREAHFDYAPTASYAASSYAGSAYGSDGEEAMDYGGDGEGEYVAERAKPAPYEDWGGSLEEGSAEAAMAKGSGQGASVLGGGRGKRGGKDKRGKSERGRGGKSGRGGGEEGSASRGGGRGAGRGGRGSERGRGVEGSRGGRGRGGGAGSDASRGGRGGARAGGLDASSSSQSHQFRNRASHQLPSVPTGSTAGGLDRVARPMSPTSMAIARATGQLSAPLPSGPTITTTSTGPMPLPSFLPANPLLHPGAGLPLAPKPSAHHQAQSLQHHHPNLPQPPLTSFPSHLPHPSFASPYSPYTPSSSSQSPLPSSSTSGTGPSTGGSNSPGSFSMQPSTQSTTTTTPYTPSSYTLPSYSSPMVPSYAPSSSTSASSSSIPHTPYHPQPHLGGTYNPNYRSASSSSLPHVPYQPSSSSLSSQVHPSFTGGGAGGGGGGGGGDPVAIQLALQRQQVQHDRQILEMQRQIALLSRRNNGPSGGGGGVGTGTGGGGMDSTAAAGVAERGTGGGWIPRDPSTTAKKE